MSSNRPYLPGGLRPVAAGGSLGFVIVGGVAGTARTAGTVGLVPVPGTAGFAGVAGLAAPPGCDVVWALAAKATVASNPATTVEAIFMVKPFKHV